MGSVERLSGLSKVLMEGHGDEVRKILVDALHALMDAEAGALCGADYGERSEDR